MRLLVLLIAGASLALSSEDGETDGEQSRKILGSSVVTSVSVIMDTGNGSKAVFTDAVGKPVPKPSSGSELASPIDLLNPDRYEFYTFDDNGDLIKRLMSLDEIQGIIATGDSDGYDIDSFTSLGYLPEKRVNDVVNNVQNVLKEEMETHKTPPDPKPIFDTPDVSDSWSIILPAVFGNSGEDIKPERPIAHVTPDTIMIEPNMPSTYGSIFDKNVITASTSFITSVSTPRSTSFPQPPSKTPTVFSTAAQMSTTEKLMTINTESTTSRIPLLTPVTEAEPKPLINVEIFSNSKSTTEKPLDQLGVENAPFVEIKPNTTTDAPKTSTTPSITTRRPPTTVKIEIPQSPIQTEIKYTSNVIESTTKQPATFVTFIPSSMGSTLPTTKSPTKPATVQDKTASITLSTLDSTQASTTSSTPVSIKQTTENHISTWRPEPFNITAAESQTITEQVPLSKFTPIVTTTEKIQFLPNTGDLPTLAELLNLNKEPEVKPLEQITTTIIPETQSVNEITTSSIVNDDKSSEEPTTTEYTLLETTLSRLENEKVQSTDRTVSEDLTTTDSELFTTTVVGTKPTDEPLESTTTQLPSEQNDDQKVSASEFLDQLLSTTNIYEINTELSQKTTQQQGSSNEDERFETSTQEQEESKTSEVKAELPTTTEQFLIKVTEQNDEPTTDRTLIDSIEQLLSQAVGNVEEVLTVINDTQTIQDMLSSSGNKNMSEVQTESATIASNLVDSNVQEGNEKTTTEMSMLDAITSGDSSKLSDSVGSLLSQVYESSRPTITSNVEVLSTETYPTSTIIPNQKNEDDIVYSTQASDKWEIVTQNTNQDLENNASTFLEPETTTETISESTTTIYVPVNTISKNNTENVSKENEFVPYLINITIISSDSTNPNIRNSSYKPAKSDISLEQMLDEEIKRNISLSDTTEMYIEQTSTSTERAIDKISNEILKAEETMAGLYNKSDIAITKQPSVTDSPTESPDLQDTTESTTEWSKLATAVSFVPLKEIPVDREPSTIVIIKKTEKPLADPYTITTPFKSNENIDTTTTADSTTYLSLETETTQFVTEASPVSTTYLILKDGNSEFITQKPKDVEPSVDVVITENSAPLSNDANFEKLNLTEIVGIKTSNTSNTGNNPQLTQSLKKEDSSTTQQRPHEKITENKPGSTWTLVPTVAPHGGSQIKNEPSPLEQYPELIDPPEPVDLQPKPLQGFGLEDSTSRLDTDIYQFAQLCNELAFGFWKTVTNGLSSARSVVVSPFGATSLLAMVFLGARGATSGEMNEILRLDDMVTFNPHLIFKNVSESIKNDEPDSGVASSAIIRELFSDRSKGKLLPFYKERARAFYDGYVEEVSFREIGDVIRRRTNLQVKKYTNGKITEYLKDSSISARSPLAGVSVNIFQTDCSQASTEGRDGELHFVVLPSIRQRRLIPVPAVVYRSGFLAGYEPSLDATAVSLGTKDQTVSTILVIPGQQGISAPGDGLSRLEKRLVESSFKKGAWSRLLRSLIPRPGLEVQIPRFSHKSVINATVALKRMGLHDLFDVEKADLRGLNGVANELFLSDMLQINCFATCGEKRIGDTHHSEIYPATALRARSSRYLDHFESEESFWRSDLLEEPRDYQRAFHDPLHDPSFLSLPLSQRPRQARVPEVPRLRFDRPFIYFVRHNPTGLILHMGRFNPRLLP